MAMTGTAKSTLLIDNDRVIVTRWDFAQPGEDTGWHRHGHDYVVVPLMNGRLRITHAEGESVADMTASAPYFRQEGVEHNVINATDGPFAFIEIEIRR
jgi:beta-alanine degradation protein BauB